MNSLLLPVTGGIFTAIPRNGWFMNALLLPVTGGLFTAVPRNGGGGQLAVLPRNGWRIFQTGARGDNITILVVFLNLVYSSKNLEGNSVLNLLLHNIS